MADFFLIVKMSQDPADDVLTVNAGDDCRRAFVETALFNLSQNTALDAAHQFVLSIFNTRLSGWVQDIATNRSADERTSLLAVRFIALPRLAGVTIPRQHWFRARMPW